MAKRRPKSTNIRPVEGGDEPDERSPEASGFSGEAAAEAATVSAEWFVSRVEELESALEEANERLQKSLKRQGELEAQAEAARVTADHLKDADSRAEKLASELSGARDEIQTLAERARSLDAERKHLGDEIGELRKLLSEREKNLGTLAAEAGKERLALQSQINETRKTLEEKLNELAATQGEARTLQDEVERLSKHLAERESALSQAARESAAERERLLSELRALQDKAEKESAAAAEKEAALREQLAATKAEENAQREKIGALEAQIGDERSASEKLRTEIEAGRAALGALEEKRAALENDLTEARTRSESLESERRELSGQVAAREQTLREELDAARAEREKAVAAFEADLRATREELLKELERREDTLREQLAAAQKERELLVTEREKALEEERGERERASERHEKTLHEATENTTRRLEEKEQALRAQMEAARSERESLRTDFELQLKESADKLEQAMAARTTLKQNLDSLRGELARVEEEKGDLTRVLREREETLRKELDSARGERERQAGVLHSTREEYEKVLREHGVLSEKSQRLDEDVTQLTASAKRESERARNMAAEVVGLEDRIRELTLQLERAQTPRDQSDEERERIAAAVAVERERTAGEFKRIREQGEDLAHRLRKAEREAENLQAARAEIERRAEAAESLVRERLQTPAPAAESAAAPAALGTLSESLGRSASDLVSSLDRLEQFMKRIPESTVSDEGTTESDVLAQKVQAMEIVGRRLENHLARLEANPADQVMLPPPGASDPALFELKQLSEAQAREMAALREQLAALAKAKPEKGEHAAPLPARVASSGDSSTLLYAVAASVLLVFGALLAGGYFAYSRLASRIDEGQSLALKYLEQSNLPRARSSAAAGTLPLPRLTDPSAGSTVRGDRIDFRGDAKGADAVFLYVGNTLYTVAGVKDGKFEFEDVPLESGKNLVALRSITDAGASSDRWESTLLRAASLGAEPPPTRAVRDFMRGPTDRKEISLTFDGDDPKGAIAVLDVLKAAGIRTTVFLTGQFIDASETVTRRIAADGHEVGNHTWDHPHLTTFEENSRHDTRPEMSKANFQSQLIRTASRYEEITGKKMAGLWRAPFGEVNSQLMRWAEELGYRHVNWTRDYQRGVTLDSLDWVVDRQSHRYFTNAEIVQKLLGFGRGDPSGAAGGIVLMHLNTRRPAGDALHERLPDLIRTWRAEGYEFVKISDMMARAEQG